VWAGPGKNGARLVHSFRVGGSGREPPACELLPEVARWPEARLRARMRSWSITVK
jgi:hypothetical protein